MRDEAVTMEVDIRLLSQSELQSMAASDPKAFDLRHLVEVEPKIDRSVFNESAGSRKQTYSRLPLSLTPNPNPNPNPNSLPRRRGRPRLQHSPAVTLPLPPPAPNPNRDENRVIVSYLRQLFDSSKMDRDPRPRVIEEKPLAPFIPIVPFEEKGDREVKNSKGAVIDLVGLAEKDDLFGEEMRRRTHGLTTAEQILGYLTGLEGQWGSHRRRRKFVNASGFGDALPKGWKLLLGVKRKEGVIFLHCHRYVSPTGKQFMSCKEVSSYILSLVGHQDAERSISGQRDAYNFLHSSPVHLSPSPTTVVNNPASNNTRNENLHVVSFSSQPFEMGSANTQNRSKRVYEVRKRALMLVEEDDRELRNGKGEVIDLVRLAGSGDLFGEEIERRTVGMETAEQMLGYIKGLHGQWESRRKKSKIVDASIFGDKLPKGWKLLLGLKRREGIVNLNCRRYVSPTGKQFVSCKGVSSYILSLVGHQDAEQSISGQRDAYNFLHLPSSPTTVVNNAAAIDNTHKESLHVVSSGQPFEMVPKNKQNHSKRVHEVHEAILMLEEDRELSNGKGEVIDLSRLAESGDLFGEEIERRTVGMTEEQILGYMKGLHGQWGSHRKKSKIVDAGMFGDKLPKGWKLLLGLKRKEKIVYLNCRRYVSPSGEQFMSCKEVASYILSLIRGQDARAISHQYDESASRPDQFTSEHVAGTTHQDGSNKELSNCSIVTPTSYVSAESEKQCPVYSYGKPRMAEMENLLDCRNCKMTFREEDEQIKHMMTSHGRGPKRRKVGESLGDVIVKDGNFECQFCHTFFNEKHSYSGHIRAHMRYQSLQGGSPPYAITTGTSDRSFSLDLVPCAPAERIVSANEKEETCTTKSADEVHIDSLECSWLGMDNNKEEHVRKPDATEITRSIFTGKVVGDSIKEDCDIIDDKFKEFTEASNVGVKFPSFRYAVKSYATKVTESVSTGKFVDDTYDHMTDDKLKELTEASNVTCVKSPSSVTHVGNPAQDCSPITQEASASKSVHFQNDYGLTSGKSLPIEENLAECVDPNVCLDAMAPPAEDMDIAPCETVSETVMPSSTSKLIDGNISDHLMDDHEPEDIVNTNNGEDIGTDRYTSEFMNDQSNYCDTTGHNSGVNTACPMSVEGNTCFDALPITVIAVDDVTLRNSSSCAVIAPVQDYNGDQKVEVENRLIALFGNGSSYGAEDYTDTIFTSSMEEHVVVDTSTDGRSVTGTSGRLTDKDTPITSTMHNDLNAGYVIPTFAREQTCAIETNVDCMFRGDLNKSILEEFDKVGNELHSCFHSSNAEIIYNDDRRQALQANVANKSSSWVRSSSPTILDMLPDQCEGKHGRTALKGEQEKLSGFEELRPGTMESPDFVLSTAREPIEFLSSDQLGWSISLPKTDSMVEVTSVCVWCNKEFIIEDGQVEPQSGSLGYICPECKS